MSFPEGLSEDQLQCPICLLVFTDPVSTPCGHNFCKACVDRFWTDQTEPLCPCCRQPCRPSEIRVNTGLRDIVQRFINAREEEEGSGARPGQVPCDVCRGSKLRAVKTCMVCLVSYCRRHLEPHRRVPGLMRHQLEEPLQNLAGRVCQKHDKVLEVFCREERVCVCVLCMKEEHLTHQTVSLEEEAAERRTGLGVRVLQMEEQVKHKASEIQDAKKCMEDRRREVETDTQESVAALEGLVASAQAHLKQMLGVMKERKESEEAKATHHLRKLHLELAELRQQSKEMEELCQTKDPLLLLNGSSSSGPPPAPQAPGGPSGGAVRQQPLWAAGVKAVVQSVEETLSREMQRVLAGEEDELKAHQHHWVEVDLDADAAHPDLVLSQDKKTVKAGVPLTQDPLPKSPKRFDSHRCVLAKKGFSSGRFYFQVEVRDQTGWEVGVVRESIQRSGPCINRGPEHGVWTLGLYQGQYRVNASPPAPSHLLGHRPQKVGVSVDYEGGRVSFYDVDSRTLMYRFSNCCFNTSRFSKLPYYYYNRTDILPFFRPGGDGVLTIGPVQQH